MGCEVSPGHRQAPRPGPSGAPQAVATGTVQTELPGTASDHPLTDLGFDAGGERLIYVTEHVQGGQPTTGPRLFRWTEAGSVPVGEGCRDGTW